MIKINDLDISNWKLTPVMDGFYSALNKRPPIKDVIEVDNPYKDGLIVTYGAKVVKSIEREFSFFCETITNYNDFIDYLIGVGFFTIQVDSGAIHHFDYLECGNLDINGSCVSFTIKVRDVQN